MTQGVKLASWSSEVRRIASSSAQVAPSARLIAKGRPRVPVIAITTDPFVARQLSMVWGVRALVSPLIDNVDELFRAASIQVIDGGLAHEGAEALFVGSLPIYRVSGRTNLLHVRKLER